MSLRRGCRRLGVSLALLWFVFWTFTYMLGAPESETVLLPAPTPSLSTACILMAVAILSLPWVIAGFRPN